MWPTYLLCLNTDQMFSHATFEGVHMCVHTELRLNTDLPLRCALASPCFAISGLDSYFSASKIEVGCDLDAAVSITKIAHQIAYQSTKRLISPTDTEEADDWDDWGHNFKIAITIPSQLQENTSSRHAPRVSLGTWNGVLDGMQAVSPLELYLDLLYARRYSDTANSLSGGR